MIEMVSDQTANQEVNPLKKGKKKKKKCHQFWICRIAVLVFLMILL
jgi:hypothetical protein